MPGPDAEPLACEQRSDDLCGCLPWAKLELMAARAKAVKDGDGWRLTGQKSVVQSVPLPTGLEGGLGFSAGLLFALLWCVLR